MKRRISHSDISKAFSPDPTALLTQLGELNVAAQPISRLATDDGDARKAATPLSTTSLSIAGQVIEQKSGLPLAGVMVKWTFSPTHTRAKNHRRNEIGSALTNNEGRFFIDAAASPEGKLLCADRRRKAQRHDLSLPGRSTVRPRDRSQRRGRGVEATIRRRLIPRIHRELLNWRLGILPFASPARTPDRGLPACRSTTCKQDAWRPRQAGSPSSRLHQFRKSELHT